MQGCALCSPGQQGYLVTLDSAASVEHAAAFLSERRLPFQSFAGGSMWIASSALRDCVECCFLLSAVNDWRFSKSLRLSNAVFDTEMRKLPWSEAVAELPAVFVDQLIERGAIRMMRQPIVDVTHGGAAVAYEMLARGFDESGKMVAPAVLFGEARAQNRLFALDKHCRIEAVKEAAGIDRNARVFINFIPTAIYRPEHCLRTTMAAARHAQVDPGRLVFEVVETDFVEDTAHLKSIFDYYRSNGVQCALDDVGSGFNGVEMLKSLAPNVIKLDRSIAAGAALDARKQEQAAAISEAARQIGAIALAEGIESADDSEALASLGYAWQQGYLFGRPEFPDQRQDYASAPLRLAA